MREMVTPLNEHEGVNAHAVAPKPWTAGKANPAEFCSVRKAGPRPAPHTHTNRLLYAELCHRSVRRGGARRQIFEMALERISALTYPRCENFQRGGSAVLVLVAPPVHTI